MKGFKKLLAIVGTKNLIAIGVLVVLVAAVGIGFGISKNKKTDNKVEESEGLQVVEDAEDSEGNELDFSEVFGEEGDEEDNNNKSDNKDGNKSDNKDGNKDGNKGDDKDNDTDDGKDNNNGGLTGEVEEDTGGFGPLF